MENPGDLDCNLLMTRRLNDQEMNIITVEEKSRYFLL